jgi:hypothetical protein
MVPQRVRPVMPPASVDSPEPARGVSDLSVPERPLALEQARVKLKVQGNAKVQARVKLKVQGNAKVQVTVTVTVVALVPELATAPHGSRLDWEAALTPRVEVIHPLGSGLSHQLWRRE